MADTVPLYIETIMKDDTLWNVKMYPALKKFYLTCILPEIILKKIKAGQKAESHPYLDDVSITV